MITQAENGFGAWQRDAVVESGSGVHEDLGRAVDAATDDVPDGAKQASESGEDGQAGNGEEDAETVGDAVGDFFGGAVARQSGVSIHQMYSAGILPASTDGCRGSDVDRGAQRFSLPACGRAWILFGSRKN